MEVQSLASIETGVVDDVVIGAMALLVDGEVCELSPPAAKQADDITVAVYCDENQQSAVILRCTRVLAERLTGRILEMPADEIGPRDMLDVTGEVVNVIAGNLRGLVSSPGTMTTPFLLDETGYAQFHTGALSSYQMMGGEMQVVRV